MKPLMTIFLALSLSLLSAKPTTGQITQAEKNYLLNYLSETAQFLTTMLSDISANDWDLRPVNGGWSIAECAEHLLISEQSILLKIQEGLRESTPKTNQESAINSNDLLLLNVQDRVNKQVKTLESFEPKGVWKNKKVFLKAFYNHREAVRDFIDRNDAALHHYFTRSPIGEIDFYQFLIVSAAHTARHTYQIENIKAERGLETLSINFGGRVKINVLASQKEKVRAFFGDLLHLEIEENKGFDKVYFASGGFVAFVYQTDPEKVLSEEQQLNSMWAAWQVPAYQYESLRNRIKAFGVKEVYPEVDQSANFYFHAPGGQVFRVIKT